MMTTKQMLLSTLILSATCNILATDKTTNKPVVFTMNINSKDFPANLPVPVSKFNATPIMEDISPSEDQPTFVNRGLLHDLINNKDKISEELIEASDKDISYVYCPTINAIMFNTEDTGQCNKCLAAILISINNELTQKNAQLENELTLLKKDSQ